MNILKAIRPLNLLILFFAQILTVYFLGFGNSLADIVDKTHLTIYVSTLLCSVFGYLFNDYMDTKADAENKPNKNYLAEPRLRNIALWVHFGTESAMPFGLTGEQIRAARALGRIEQAELAKRSGLSLETIKRLERLRRGQS